MLYDDNNKSIQEIAAGEEPLLFLREHNGTEPAFIATEDHLRVAIHNGPSPSDARD
jgi:hypothetical protein